MKTATRQLLVLLLQGDETVTSDCAEAALAVLEGRTQTQSVSSGPLLVTKSAAAARIGISRTHLWGVIRSERNLPAAERQFIEVEISPGVYRLRASDVEAFVDALARKYKNK